MNKDIALRLALEALESTGENDGYHGVDQYFDNVLVDKAITALRLAIDAQNMASKSTYKEQLETKDEPVAWMNKHGACKTSLFREMEAGAKEEYTIPLYTTPQRTWVGLKDDDEIPWDGVDAKSFARAIEAKLKEKNT